MKEPNLVTAVLNPEIEFNHCKVNFNRAIFGNGGLSFEGSELKSGKFNFKKVQTGNGGFDFSIAEFENAEAYFDGSVFGKGSMNFINSKFIKLSLNHAISTIIPI